jgi:HD-GYP domain-containing protein (c-di-GMP phosphodiesterase class II)
MPWQALRDVALGTNQTCRCSNQAMESLNPTHRSSPRTKRLDKPIKTNSVENDCGATIQILIDLSQAHQIQGQTSQSLDLLYQALTMAQELKAVGMQAQVHDLLYRTHKATGSPSSALNHLEQRLSLQNHLTEHRHYQQMISGLTQELGKVRTQSEGYRAQIRVMEQTVLERAQALESAQIETLERLATAGEQHEAYSPGHTRRVGDMAGRIAAALGFDLQFTGQIRLAARLHDIGKIAISDHILQKPGKLTEEEAQKVQLHTLIGAEILAGSPSNLMRMAEEVALCHHERWDGAGYPQKLAGEAIPISARIVAVADAFDVMTHQRPYKNRWPEQQALDELRQAAGTHFDSRIVHALLLLHH